MVGLHPTQFKNIDAKIAGAQLGVPNILTGSVRRSAETIRVDTQLVSAADGVERWAQTYDRAPGDAIKIQTDIAQSVAKALSLALGQAARAALTLGGTADAAAQDLILKSRKLSRDSTDAEILRRRVGLAEAAIARDPHYAEAYVEKADALYYLAINYAPTAGEVAGQAALAAAAAQKAVALAPRLGTAHAALAQIAEARLRFHERLTRNQSFSRALT